MSLSKPFEESNLQNASQIVRNSGLNLPTVGRSAPVLPPRPFNSQLVSNGYSNTYNSYMPSMPMTGPSYGGYSSYSTPYRSSVYNSYGAGYGTGYGGVAGYGSFGGPPAFAPEDHERRFIQYAEESSRKTFANVESIVRAFNSIAMMLDNTFFAMTSSFRAVLSVAENFGRLRTMFANIWYSVNVFRFLGWLYRKLMSLLGYRAKGGASTAAWKQATGAAAPGAARGAGPGGSSWPTIAFLGMLVSAPYIISKFLPKYEDKGDPANWTSPGIRAKAVFDFIATSPNELTFQTNDLITLAPTYIQDEMNLKNSGWAFAVCKGKSGVVPLNYLVINKSRPPILNTHKSDDHPPIPRVKSDGAKTHTKRVSFGENQIFENVDLDDYMPKEAPSSRDGEKRAVDEVETNATDRSS